MTNLQGLIFILAFDLAAAYAFGVGLAGLNHGMNNFKNLDRQKKFDLLSLAVCMPFTLIWFFLAMRITFFINMMSMAEGTWFSVTFLFPMYAGMIGLRLLSTIPKQTTMVVA